MTMRLWTTAALLAVVSAGCQSLAKTKPSAAAPTAAASCPSQQCQQCQHTASSTAPSGGAPSDVQQAVLYGGSPMAQQAVYVEQPAASGGVQLAGYPAGDCPTCQPAGQHRIFHRGQATTAGPGPHSYGGGTFPYGSQYDHGHPGRPFDGGRYGYAGGAHGTPGYPHHHFSRNYVGPQGPPTAQTAYPYYTLRGPRDFLIDNPPSIGR